MEAMPTELALYGRADWPVRQANPETSGGRTCSSRCFAERGSDCPERERSRDADSHGTRRAPRRQRAASPSGVWLTYRGPRCLLSAHGKQQVCCWFGTFSSTKTVSQAPLARRESQSKRLHVRDTSGFGLRRAFSVEILNSLRRQTYQAFLIRMSRAALRACPQAQASVFWIDFRKIHRRPIAGTSDSRNHVHLVRLSVLGQDEVSTMEKQKATIVRIHCRLITTISAATKG